MNRNVDWFKKEIEPHISGYNISYRYFEEGDFGSLNQVIFDSERGGGGIDFWGLGWIGIEYVDYKTGDYLINTMHNPEDVLQGKTDVAFDKLLAILSPNK